MMPGSFAATRCAGRRVDATRRVYMRLPGCIDARTKKVCQLRKTNRMPCAKTGAEECLCYLKTKKYYDVVTHHVDVHLKAHFTTPTEDWFDTNAGHFKCVTEKLNDEHYTMKDVSKAHDVCNTYLPTKFKDDHP